MGLCNGHCVRVVQYRDNTSLSVEMIQRILAGTRCAPGGNRHSDHCIMAGSLATIAMFKGKEAESCLVTLEVTFLLCDALMTVSGTLVTPG